MARILLCCGASAALYKSCDLASKLAQAGHQVRALLTPNAAKLVAPQLFEAVSGEPAQVDEFGAERRGAMDHIELSKWGELLLVSPATASLVTRLAHGIGSDLVGTVALAFDPRKPRLVCPAMNPVMFDARPVQRALALLREDGWEVLEPESGHMACGDEGKGRLVEPQRIVARVAQRLAAPKAQ